MRDGRYELGTEVVFWENHRGGNQKFKINEDSTISPIEKPEHVIGWKQAFKDEEMASIEEIASLLARIHKFPTEWYDEWREKLCETWPVLRDCPIGSHAWWFTARKDWIMSSWKEDKLRDWFKMCPTPVSEISSRIVTCHGDFHVKNLVITPDRRLLGIDYEFACATFAIQDISWALAIWVKGAELKRAFIKTYLEQSGLDTSPETVDTVLLDAEHCGLACCFFRPLME